MGVREGCARNLAHGRARRVQLREEATRALKSPRVGHIAAEFERLANVLLRRGCGNPALITYPPGNGLSGQEAHRTSGGDRIRSSYDESHLPVVTYFTNQSVRRRDAASRPSPSDISNAVEGSGMGVKIGEAEAILI
jgi:hypothetical protein